MIKDLIVGSENARGHGKTNRSRKCKETEGDSPSVSFGSRFGNRLFHASFERMLTIGLKKSTFLDQGENPLHILEEVR
jgi:hypothetical protein